MTFDNMKMCFQTNMVVFHAYKFLKCNFYICGPYFHIPLPKDKPSLVTRIKFRYAQPKFGPVLNFMPHKIQTYLSIVRKKSWSFPYA